MNPSTEQVDISDYEYANSRELYEFLQKKSFGDCGVTGIQDPRGANREVVDLLLAAACDNDIRGGRVKDARDRATGDGAGIMLRTDNDTRGRGMQSHLKRRLGHDVPLNRNREQLHSGLFFIDAGQRENLDQIGQRIHATLAERGLRPLAWKAANVNPEAVSPRSRAIMPLIQQLIYAEGEVPPDQIHRALFEARLKIQRQLEGVSIVSLQPGTMVYKGMATGSELSKLYPDLLAEDVVSDAGIVHTRFGTNVLAHWALAHPFPLLAHNGEVNSIRLILETLFFLERHHQLPSTNIMRGGSDSANLDRALQMLQSHGLTLEEAVRFMMHPSPDELRRMPKEFRNFFEGIARVVGGLKAIGPIALLTMDRHTMTATLDNMGFRPLRYIKRDDGLLIIGSEVGIPHIDPSRVDKYGRLSPGEQLIVDRSGKREYGDSALRRVLGNRRSTFRSLAKDRLTSFPPSPDSAESSFEKDPSTRIDRSNLFGLNRERLQDLKLTLRQGKDPIDGMGSDLALPLLSSEPHSTARYLRVNYAQVTNPSVDHIRRKEAFSLKTLLGRKPTQKEFGRHFELYPQLILEDPLLDEGQMSLLYKKARETDSDLPVCVISTKLSTATKAAFDQRIHEIATEVIDRAEQRLQSIIVLSDRDTGGEGTGYIPPHLLVSYLRKNLDDRGLGHFVSLVVESGEIFDQHEYATLISCGADAVHPHMIYEWIESGELDTRTPKSDLKSGLRRGFNATLLRYMAKLGITDIDGYRSGRHFSTLCLDYALARRFFGNIETNLQGVTLETLLDHQAQRAHLGGGLRRSEEKHGWRKTAWSALQEVGESDHLSPDEAYCLYLEKLRELGPLHMRDLLRIKRSVEPIPLHEVMSAKEIIRNFIQGADISFGSINERAHSAFHAIFNRYGSMAGSGEGGIPEDRWKKRPDQLDDFPQIMQVASGLFGVTGRLLSNPRVKINRRKIGQGAKPGVGGHLPGQKVTPLVAKTRGVEPGQELASPNNNPQIYSIEDLEGDAQKLKALNPAARYGIKITSGANVRTIAAGCVKAGAEQLQISGELGGTGAATLTDKFCTGLPIEIGLIHAHDALVRQGLRELVSLGVDGGIRTGMDVLKLIMMGADTAALGTAILIAQQKCIFCNNCSTQKCPSDITRTRSTFLGAKKGARREALPEQEQRDLLIEAGSNFLELMAEEIRRLMADMGVRNLGELVGRRELLEIDPAHAKLASELQMDELLKIPTPLFTPTHPLLDLYESLADQVSPWIKEITPPPLRARLHETRRRFSTTLKDGLAQLDQHPRLRQRVRRRLNPHLSNPDRIEFYLNHPVVNEANRTILRGVHGQSASESVIIDLELRPRDRAVGATLCGAVRSRELIKFPPRGIKIRSKGNAGQGYGFGLTDGITMEHRGATQNETAEIQDGGRLVILPPEGRLSQRNDLALVGNTLGCGARGGDRFICASVGDQACIRETGGRTLITGNTGKYFGEYKTGGRDIVLGKLGPVVGPGMSGGVIYARDYEIQDKLSNDVCVTLIIPQKDLDLVRADLEDFYNETHDQATLRILDHWNEESKKIRKIIPKTHYEVKVFGFLYEQIISPSTSVNPETTIIAELFEMLGVDFTTKEDFSLLHTQIHEMLMTGVEELRQRLTQIKPIEIEERFMETRRFATQLTERIHASMFCARVKSLRQEQKEEPV